MPKGCDYYDVNIYFFLHNSFGTVLIEAVFMYLGDAVSREKKGGKTKK